MNVLENLNLAAKTISRKIDDERCTSEYEVLDNWEKSVSYSILIAGLITLILQQL